MLHTTMIVLHATAAVVAFVAGFLALFPSRVEQQSPWFQVYLGSLGLMLVFLLGAMASHWQRLSTAEQVIFGGLFLLGLYMGWRALSARALLMGRSGQWRLPYMEHIGFTLIALWDGFVVVLAIDLGGTRLLAVVLAVLGVVVGNRALHRAEGRAGVLQ